MAFTMINSSGPVFSARIAGKLRNSEVTEMQAAALEAIRRCGKTSALFILDHFQDGTGGTGVISRS